MYATIKGCEDGEGKIENFPGSGGYDVYFKLDEMTVDQAQHAAADLARHAEEKGTSFKGLNSKKHRIKSTYGGNRWVRLKKEGSRYTLTTKGGGGFFGF